MRVSDMPLVVFLAFLSFVGPALADPIAHGQIRVVDGRRPMLSGSDRHRSALLAL
jgi:hypothetical protein